MWRTLRRFRFWLRTEFAPRQLATGLVILSVALCAAFAISFAIWKLEIDLVLAERREVRDALALLKSDDARTRERGANKLGSMGDAAVSAVPELLDRLDDTYYVANALGYICQGGECLESVADKLVSKAQAGDTSACYALHRMKDPRAFDLMVALLPKDSRQGLLARTLASFGDPRAVMPLLRHEINMQRNMMWSGRGCAGIAQIGEVAVPEFRAAILSDDAKLAETARGCMFTISRHGEDDFFRTESMRALGRELLRSGDADLIETAVWIARAQESVFEFESILEVFEAGPLNPEVLDRLCVAFRDPQRGAPLRFQPHEVERARAVVLDTSAYMNLRDRVVQCLGTTGDHSLTNDLISLLAERPLRRSAVWALGELGDEAAVPHLLDVCREDESDPHGAVAALARLGSVEVFDTLASQLRDEHRSRYAITSLAILGDARAVPLLEGLIGRIQALSMVTDSYVYSAIARINGGDEFAPYAEAMLVPGSESKWLEQRRLFAGGEAARTHFIRLANHHEWGDNALRALADLGYNDPQFQDLLARVVVYGWPAPRTEAVRLIEEHNDRRFIRCLIASIGEHSTQSSGGQFDYGVIPAALLLREWTGKNYMLNYRRWERWWTMNRHKFPEALPLGQPFPGTD